MNNINITIVIKLKKIFQEKSPSNSLKFIEMDDNAFVKLQLTEIGFDSLDLAEIIMAIEEEFNITLDDTKVNELKSIDELVSMIKLMIAQ